MLEFVLPTFNSHNRSVPAHTDLHSIHVCLHQGPPVSCHVSRFAWPSRLIAGNWLVRWTISVCILLDTLFWPISSPLGSWLNRILNILGRQWRAVSVKHIEVYYFARVPLSNGRIIMFHHFLVIQFWIWTLRLPRLTRRQWRHWQVCGYSEFWWRWGRCRLCCWREVLLLAFLLPFFEIFIEGSIGWYNMPSFSTVSLRSWGSWKRRWRSHRGGY